MSTFGFSSTTDDVLAGVDLASRLAVITGASTGLGEETTRALADHDAEVVMAVRDVGAGRPRPSAWRQPLATPSSSRCSSSISLAPRQRTCAFAELPRRARPAGPPHQQRA